MKILHTSLYLFVFYAILINSVIPALAISSINNFKTKQFISYIKSESDSKNTHSTSSFKPRVDDKSNPDTIGAATRFRPRVDDKSNPDTVGAATRSSHSCLNQQKITSLLPSNQLGLTLKKHPVFFWHIPSSSAKIAQFTLLTQTSDGYEEVVYETNLDLPEKTGIISFTLPEQVESLKANTNYRWFLTIICDNKDYSKNPYVQGIVKRIPPELPSSQSPKKEDLLTTATIYAQTGIWHDALTSLVKLRCQKPNDTLVKSHWLQFLDSVGLNEIASEPLINYCSQQN